jgi:hypothetical protein
VEPFAPSLKEKAMPQARSSGSKSTASKPRSSSSSKAKPTATAAKRSTTAAKRSTTAAKRSTASTASRASSSAKAKAGAPDARLEAAATRLRKLNERIIDAGKEAGETTLASYEKALKAIASSIESGPGKSEIDWISHLATTQAKFLRDVTNAWTSAARGALK